MKDPLLVELDRHRKTVTIPSGEISYLDVGEGRPALLVHGAGTNAFFWRNVIAALRGERRLVAIDLPHHGRSPSRPGQDFSLHALARSIEEIAEALALGPVDLVAHDSGGAIAQVVAARARLAMSSLTLTNCNTQDTLPPPAFAPVIWAARLGLLAYATRWLARRPANARRGILRLAYQHPERISDDVILSYTDPVLGTFEDARELERFLVSIRARDLAAIEPALRRVQVPTLIVWATGDRFFGRDAAQWLARTIPGTRTVVELETAKLFFPDERAEDLVAALRKHWADHAPSAARKTG